MVSFRAEANRIARDYKPPIVGRAATLGNAGIIRAFLRSMAAGNYLDTAADVAGISKQTVYNWIKRGEAHERPYDRFLDAYKKACATAEANAVHEVRTAGKAGPQHWTASMTFLERRFPERWARRQDRETGPQVVVQIGATPDQVALIERQVRAVAGPQTADS